MSFVDFNKKFIIQLRDKFRKEQLGEIYIISNTYDYKYKFDNRSIIDGLIYFPSYESLEPIDLGKKNNIFLYQSIIY